MEPANCMKCGKLYSRSASLICPACDKIEEELFDKVRLFLADNPKSFIEEVSETTGVSPKKILKYIREGRLIVTAGFSNELTCNKCGKPLNTGKLCDKCRISVNQELSKLYEEKKSGIGMHTYKEEKKDGRR